MRRARSILVRLLPIFWAICVGSSLASDAVDPAPAELEALMERFAASGGVRARFEEFRQLSILTDPIETTGMLYFAPPDRLARHTTWPGHSRIVVDAGRVSFGDETGQRVFNLSTSEVARALVGNMMFVLRGDLASIRSSYSLSFDSNADGWTLELEPRSPALSGIIEKVVFFGRDQNLTAIETQESNGDRTIMKFSEVETGISWKQQDLDRIFSIDPPETTP